MSKVQFKCFSCGTEVRLDSSPGRREECLKCGADLHVCRNCRHYDSSAYNECREPSADVVREKDRSNFCDFFDASGANSAGGADKKNDLLAAAEALFKKKT